MSRRRRAERRITAPDPRYNDVELARFINRLMLRGRSPSLSGWPTTHLPLFIANRTRTAGSLQQALRNATPAVEVRPKRVGGATIQVPTELRTERSEALAMRWLIRGARSRKGMPMRRGLALELMDASRGEGSAVRRREELHRMAEANRAFVHYRR